ARSPPAREPGPPPPAVPALSRPPRGRRSSCPPFASLDYGRPPVATPQLYGSTRRVEKARLATLPLRGRARPADHGRGRAGEDRCPAYPARLEGGLDLVADEREAAGDGNRQGGPAAVHLPPGLSRASGAGEIRQARAFRGAASRVAAHDGQAPGSRAAQLRMDGRGRRPPDQRGLVP